MVEPVGADRQRPLDDAELDDVTLLTALTLSGSFTDARTLSSTYALNVQCSGDDCGWAELAGYSFPCDVNFSLTAAAD